jgi:ABC-2 type transport system permease protein
MRKIWDIAWLYIYTTYKDRSTLMYGFALPLIFTAVLGVGIAGFGDGEAQTRWPLLVVDRDQGSMSTQLIERLEADPTLNVEVASELTEQEDAVPAVLLLPETFSEQLLAGERLDLILETNAEDSMSDGQIVQQAVQTALNEVSSSLQIAQVSVRVAKEVGLFDIEGSPDRDAYAEEARDQAAELWQAGPPVTVEGTQVTRREDTSTEIAVGFQQTSPGIGVMFTMFFITYGGATLLLEREQGTLRRLLTTPISKASILAGKVLGVFISGAVQFTILVLFGQFVFGVDWGRQPVALALMIIAFIFAITCFSIMLAALVRTYAQVDALATVIILPMSALGGAMWPNEITPPFMQTLGMFMPTGWAMRGFHDIITRGLGVQDVLLEAGILFGFGALFLAIGAWRFKFE